MVSGPTRRSIVPAYADFLWPTLQALKALGNSGTIQEIYDRAIELAGLTEEQLQELHKDGPDTEAAYRLAWARTYLKWVGAITNTHRGVWTITEHGQTLSQADMAHIPARARAISSRKSSRHESSSEQDNDRGALDDKGVPVDSTTPSFTSTIADRWREYLLDVLMSMPPVSFEKLCQRVLRESGFTKVEVTGRSGDGGIDGIGVLRVSLLSFQVFFQCKRYRGSVGAGSIRDFRGAMVGRTDKGLFITTGTFTPDAKREATRDGAPVLDLVDGEALCTILKDLGLGVSTQQVEEVTVDADWLRSL